MKNKEFKYGDKVSYEHWHAYEPSTFDHGVISAILAEVTFKNGTKRKINIENTMLLEGWKKDEKK